MTNDLTAETHIERFIKLVGFFNIQNNHNGIIDFDGLMKDLKTTKEYQQILSDKETVERLKNHTKNCLTTYCWCSNHQFKSILDNK